MSRAGLIPPMYLVTKTSLEHFAGIRLLLSRSGLFSYGTVKIPMRGNEGIVSFLHFDRIFDSIRMWESR